MNRIKQVLEEKGIKQTWLAEKLGKSYPVINGYVQNRVQPRLEILYEIARLLSVDVKDLLVSESGTKGNKK
jgi:putative transcriptional regulator